MVLHINNILIMIIVYNNRLVNFYNYNNFKKLR